MWLIATLKVSDNWIIWRGQVWRNKHANILQQNVTSVQKSPKLNQSSRITMHSI